MNKKGSSEMVFILFVLFFFTGVSLASNFFIDDNQIEERSFSSVVDELSEEMGAVAGWVTGLILGIGDVFFSILGVSLIDTIGVFPIGVNVFFSLLSISAVVVIIVWIVGAFF